MRSAQCCSSGRWLSRLPEQQNGNSSGTEKNYDRNQGITQSGIVFLPEGSSQKLAIFAESATGKTGCRNYL